MVLKIIYYYNLYILLLPFFIFSLTYFYTILRLSIYFKMVCYEIEYYPEETESILVNYIYILPKRLGFNSVYYFSKKALFNLKTLVNILKTLIIIIIIGLPFIFILIFINFLSSEKVWDIWLKVSPYKKIKLVSINGKLIRNMKKSDIYIHLKHVKTSMKNRTNLIEEVKNDNISGLLEIKKGVHGIAVNKKMNSGVTFTTKKQSGDLEVAELFSFSDKKKSYAIAQKFGENIIIPVSKIKNNEIYKLVKENSEVLAVGASNTIARSRSSHIILNEHNIQKKIVLSDLERIKHSNFIKEVGGEEKIDKIVKFEIFYIDMVNRANKVLFDLANSSKDAEERIKIIVKNKEIIDALIEYNLNMSSSPSLSKREHLLKVFSKIDSLICEVDLKINDII